MTSVEASAATSIAVLCTVSGVERVVIVGAGTFGASLAWHLAGRGDDVVLVDQFEPGDVRATSGGETRLIRCGHGTDADYTRDGAASAHAVARARGRDRRVRCTPRPACRGSHTRTTAGRPSRRRRCARSTSRSSARTSGRRTPSFAGDDLTWVLHEPEAGVLRAQRAVQTLAGAAAARGARIVRGRATPDGDRVRLGDEVLDADRVVWSCGGWLAKLFPERRPAARDVPGAVLPRRRPRVGARTRVDRLRPRRLRHRGPRRPRRQVRVGCRKARRWTPMPTSRPPRPRRRRACAATSPTASPRSRPRA